MLPAVSVNVAKWDLSNDTRNQANAEKGVLICLAPTQRTADNLVCWGWENSNVGNPEVTFTQDFFQRKYFVISNFCVYLSVCVFACVFRYMWITEGIMDPLEGS